MPYSGTCCVVPQCSMRPGTNRLSRIRMFSFPRDNSRRSKWIVAVKRENWSPSVHSKVCSRHFIEGKPSADPLHPDWVPSVFSFGTIKRIASNQQSIARYGRSKTREQEQQLLTNTSDNNVPDVVNSPAAPGCEDENTDTEEQSHRDAQIQTDPPHTDSLTADHLCLKQSIKEIFHSQEQLRFYTGIVKVEIFKELLEFVISFWKPPFVNITPDEQLLLVLMRLRLGLTVKDLAYRFGISPTTVSRIICKWIDAMAPKLSSFIKWPKRKSVRRMLPEAFKDEMFKNVIGIVDCSEIFIERPCSLHARAQTYSQYKGHNTIKFLIVISPCGAVTFISKCWGGRVSDKHLTKECGLLDYVQAGDVFLVDRGFPCEELFAAKCAKLLNPAFTRGKKQLSGEEGTCSRKISRIRIHVERAIRRIKVFKLLSGTIPVSTLKNQHDTDLALIDKILLVVAALVNLQGPLIAK